MATREALRDLQTRLAQRLQAAQTEGLTVAWLAVQAGAGNYLLPLGQSGEIVPLTQAQAVPYARPWFRGVINIRGTLHGVVDLAGFLAEQAGTPHPAPVRDASPVAEITVVTLNPLLEVNCALQVDALAGLRGGDAFVSQAPAAAGAPAYFGRCCVDGEGQRWQEIQLEALAQSPEFLGIGI